MRYEACSLIDSIIPIKWNKADVKNNNNLTGYDPGLKRSFGQCIGFLLNVLSIHGQNDVV